MRRTRRKRSKPLGKHVKGWDIYEGDVVTRLSDGASYILVGRKNNVMLIRHALPPTVLPSRFHEKSLPLFRVHPSELNIQSR